MNITAKPIVDGKFWIVEEDGEKVATLHKQQIYVEFKNGRSHI